MKGDLYKEEIVIASFNLSPRKMYRFCIHQMLKTEKNSMDQK